MADRATLTIKLEEDTKYRPEPGKREGAPSAYREPVRMPDLSRSEGNAVSLTASQVADIYKPFEQDILALEEQRQNLNEVLTRDTTTQGEVVKILEKQRKLDLEISKLRKKQADALRPETPIESLSVSQIAAMYRPFEQDILALEEQRQKLMKTISADTTSEAELKAALEKYEELSDKVSSLRNKQARQEYVLETEAVTGQDVVEKNRPFQTDILRVEQEREDLLHALENQTLGQDQIHDILEEINKKVVELTVLRDRQAKEESETARMRRLQFDEALRQKEVKDTGLNVAGFMASALSRIGFGAMGNVLGAGVEGFRFGQMFGEHLDRFFRIPKPAEPPAQPTPEQSPVTPSSPAKPALPVTPSSPAKPALPGVTAKTPVAPTAPKTTPGGGSLASKGGPIGAAVMATTAALDEFGKTLSSSGQTMGAAMELDSHRFQRAINDNLIKPLPIVGGLLGGFGDAVLSVMEGADRLAERLGSFNPQIAQAQAMADVSRMMADIQRAQTMGSELSRYVTQRAELDRKMEDVMMKLSLRLLPAVIRIMEAMENMLSMVENLETTVSSGGVDVLQLANAAMGNGQALNGIMQQILSNVNQIAEATNTGANVDFFANLLNAPLPNAPAPQVPQFQPPANGLFGGNM